VFQAEQLRCLPDTGMADKQFMDVGVMRIFQQQFHLLDKARVRIPRPCLGRILIILADFLFVLQWTGIKYILYLGQFIRFQI
jgi:hypothetical protein